MDEKEARKKKFTSNEKLKANRASETEEQMKKRLRIGREKDIYPKNYKRKRKSRQKQKIMRNSAWSLSKE